MTKITQLTPGQEMRLAQVYEEWLAVGRGCDPLDRTAATEIIGQFYQRIGKPAPAVLFFSSPLMCLLAYGALRVIAPDQLRDQLRDQLGDQLGGQLGDQLGGQLRGQLTNYFAGQHWCAWEVFHAFCGEIGVRYAANQQALLDLWLRQSKGLHWWFPYDGIVLASERHGRVAVDDAGRLHHAMEMACAYSDGWGIHAWHGVRIPARYYERQPTGAEILAEPNAEVRRCLIERHDELNDKGSFIRGCGAKLIDSAVQPMANSGYDSINELLAIGLPRDPERRMVYLHVIDPSTGREYYIRVPPDQKTVRGALAWTFDMPESEYILQAES